MAITYVRPNDHHHLQNIANLLGAASKIVTVTGAGISTNAGIPDFRSRNGVHSSGYRHLFHWSVLFDTDRRPLFYKRIADMRRAAERANPTKTHRFIRDLCDSGKLVRNYTQNIDGLEGKVGLLTDVRKGPGSRSSFHRRSRLKRNHRVGHERRRQDDSRGVECVLLHGSLHRLRCSNCPGTFGWNEGSREMESLPDREPSCPGCTKISEDRKAEGKRATAVGKLRPDIVLYDEQDPRAEWISAIARHDQSLRPDALLIMGTSLATHGVQLLIRDFAKVIHERPAGKVVFVNLTEPAKSWDSVIDYWVKWDCDAWVTDLVKRQPALLCGNNGSLIPKILIDLTEEDGQLEHKSPGSSRENPIDLTL
ncbi:hypothetical protein VTK26DRAFT_8681 [Humicola hyalothermophila]